MKKEQEFVTCPYLWVDANSKDFAIKLARQYEARLWLVEFAKVKKGQVQSQNGYYIAKKRKVVTDSIGDRKAKITEVKL
jgi:hypothetical protein